jgi:hypothetical protein
MPSPGDFRKSFGFPTTHDGLFHGYAYEEASFKHVVKKRNERYEFPITIIFINASKEDILTALKKSIPKETTVLSAFGNPYKCTVGRFAALRMSNGKVKVNALGVAIRNRSEPVTGKNGTKRKHADLPIMEGWQVLTSHFATGHCMGCNKSITVGEPIAKKIKSSRKRGGWFHAECARLHTT